MGTPRPHGARSPKAIRKLLRLSGHAAAFVLVFTVNVSVRAQAPAAPPSGGAAPVAPVASGGGSGGGSTALPAVAPGAGGVNGAVNVENLSGKLVTGTLDGSKLMSTTPTMDQLGFGNGNLNYAAAAQAGSGYGTAAMCASMASVLIGGLGPAAINATTKWGDDLERQARGDQMEEDHMTRQQDINADTVVGFDCDKEGESTYKAKITMGYNSDTKCTRDKMDRGMAAHMDKVFLECVRLSAQAAGFQQPAAIHINHMGCHHVRNVAGTNTASLHSWGRALDIGAIIFKPSGQKVSMHIRESHKPGNKEFYNSLRKCWARNLPASCRGGGGRESFGSIGYNGSDGPANGKHADHMHLSWPPCAGGAM